MTPIILLFGTGLFLILLLVFFFLLNAQTSPQSVMLEKVSRERRTGRPGQGDATVSVLVELIAKPFALVRRTISQGPDPAVVRRLAVAGYRRPAHADLFLGAKIGVPALFAILTTFIIQENILFFLAVAIIVGFFAPDFWLAEAVNRRQNRISETLPDALDLMSICMDAGLSLDQAIVRVGQELRSAHPELSQELLQINFEQRAGMPRVESWRAFAERIDIDSLRQFVAMLVQTERFGTPIGVALVSFSESLRTERRQKAEEMGAKAAIKMMFPLILFIFPMVFVVTLGPAVIGLLKNLVTLLE